MRHVLLVTGSRSLAQTPAARAWAEARIAEALAWLRAGEVPTLVHGDCEGSPDVWAHDAAKDILRIAYDASGRICVTKPGRDIWTSWERWKPDARFAPLVRNRHMVDVVARWELTQPATVVRVLGLRAPWAKTHGTEATIRYALASMLDVIGDGIGLVCPAEYGRPA